MRRERQAEGIKNAKATTFSISAPKILITHDASKAVAKLINNQLNKENYDFVFYVAGVDIHHEDRLGKLKISDEGINKRDQIVIENFYSKNIPLCGVLGGGYNKSFEKLIELHSMLHKNCASII